MELKKATRKTVKLRLNLSGASGSGKTYSALLMAFGIIGDWSKIAVIDTENGSASLYSHLGSFNVIDLQAPYSPERYIEAIEACTKGGMQCIIIDSSSHEWNGSGGCIDLNEKLAQSKYRGNTWSAWNEITPRHDKFVNTVLQSPIHIITCTRSKMETIMGEDKKVKKVGMKDIQRDGWEYELTVSLNIERDTHMAISSKDRTELFEGSEPFLITSETGKRILKWCETGVDELEVAVTEMKAAKSLDELKACWLKWNQYQKDVKFSAMKDEIKAKLTPEPSKEIEKLLAQSIAMLDNVDSLEKLNAAVSNIPELQNNDLFIKSVNAATLRLTPKVN